MKSLFFISALLLAGAFAQQGSICDRYSTATGLNNSALVGTVIGQVVGIVAVNQSSITAQFFNGQTPPGSTNFLTNSAAFNTLFLHLVQFFGVALGCTDGTIGAYTGNSNMAQVHAQFPINNASFVFFNKAVIDVMGGLGVAAADLTTVAGVLEGTRDAICNQPDCRNLSNSICDRYSIITGYNNSALVGAVVGGVVQIVAVNQSAVTAKFFNGQSPSGSTNFLTNTAALNTLVLHLVQFFGSALGCTDRTIAAYSGNPDMAAVHRNMQIDNTTFNFFNQAVISVMRGFGVAETDLTSVLAVLETTRTAICNQPDCASDYVPTTGSSFSYNVMPVVALVGTMGALLL